MPNRLSASELATFHADSLIHLGQLFTSKEMAEVRAAMDKVLLAPPPGVEVIREDHSNAVRSVMGWEQAHPVLDEFFRDSRVLGPVQSVIGNDTVSHQGKWNPKVPELGDKWDPHRGFTFWHNLDGVPDPAGMVSVFVAVTDQTKKNGATFTWKGAHRKTNGDLMTIEDLRDETDFGGRTGEDTSRDTGASLSLQIKPERIEEYTRRFETVDLTGPAGTVWLLDSRNLHASQQNGSDAVRILVANVYRALGNAPKHPRPKEFLCGTSTTPLRTFEAGR